MNKKILNKIIRRIKIELKWFLTYAKHYKKKNAQCIILVNTPTHGNLGDHALALAGYNLFNESFPNYEVIEIPGYILHSISISKLKKVIKNHAVFIHAGGYLGTLWPNEETNVRKILSNFPYNKIVILPQTITYSNDDQGAHEKEISKKLYQKCKKLYLFVRNESSLSEGYELAGHQNTFLVPDMVVGYLPYHNSNIYRNNTCLFCLRNDKERVSSATMTNALKQIVTTNIPGISIQPTDTVQTYSINQEQRFSEVTQKLNEFASARLVVTDRLHGMLFAAITGTPCIAINNSNGKVKDVYTWIKEIPYVRFIDTMDDFENALTCVLKHTNNRYPFNLMKGKYEVLRNKLKEILAEKGLENE